MRHNFFHLVFLRIIISCCLLLAVTGNLGAASFKISNSSDFSAAGTIFNGVVASETTGAAANFLRLRNTNPGEDDGNPGLKFGGRGVWAKKREIALTIPNDIHHNGTTNLGKIRRYAEKCQLEIAVIGNAKDDWSDLRLTNGAGAQVPFRLLDYERPTDNPSTQVNLLFEADANPSTPIASNTYHLYYANKDAASDEDATLSRFYILNHDFEDGLNSWGLSPNGTGTGIQSADGFGNLTANPHAIYPTLALETGMSIIPSGYSGFNSDVCLSMGFPENVVNGAYAVGSWRAYQQTITVPSTGTYILMAQRRFTSASFNTGWATLMFIKTGAAGRDRRYDVAAGFSDWMESTVDFTTNTTRTAIIGLGMQTRSVAGQPTIRERRSQVDWIEIKPKYPLELSLSDEMPAGYSESGVYESKWFDTGINNPVFESLAWSANTTAPGTAVAFQTRTALTTGGPYSAWSALIDINGSAISNPVNRYIQVRAILNTADTSFSPILNEITVFYSLPIASFRVDAPAMAGAGEFFDFRVTAVDQNNATVTAFVGNVNLSANSPTLEFPRSSHAFTTFDNGTTVFQARNPIAETFRITATAGAVSSYSLPIQTTPAPTVSLVMQGFPAAITAGDFFSGQIVAKDRYGNTDTNSNGQIIIQTTDVAPASFPASVNLVAGIGNLSNCSFFTVPTQRVQVNDATSGVSTHRDFLVNPGVATKLSLNADPDQYQNVSFDLKIAAIDDYGNLNTSVNTSFTLTPSLGSIAAPTGNLVAGQCTHPVTLDTSGNLTLSGLTATSLAGNLGLSVHPKSPPTLSRFLVDAGYDQLAGVPFTLTIEARDNSEQILTSYDGACRIIPNVGQCSPAMTTGYKFLDGFLAIPISLSGADSNVILRIEDVKDSSKIGLLFLNVRPAGLAEFEIDTPPAADAGATFTFTIRARDNQGNLLTNYTGTAIISHTATGGDVTIPQIYTFTSSDAGIKTFSGVNGAIFTKAENIKIQVEDSGKVGLSELVTIEADGSDPVVQLRPDILSVDLGTSLSFNLYLKDRFDNALEDFTGTVNFTYSDPTVVGPANYTFQNFENGFKRFLLAIIPANLGDFTITATDALSGNSDTTDVISVVSGETINFTLSPSTISLPAGRNFSFAVTASNSAGDLNEQYNGGIRFATLDSRALIPQDSTLVNGQGTFQATYYTAGAYQLSVFDINAPGITGNMNVTVQASAPRRLEFELPSYTTAAGTPAAYSVKIVDAYGNLASFSGSVSLSSTDNKATSTPSPQVITFTNQSIRNGLWTFTTAGTQKLRATVVGLTAADSQPILVNAGLADRITGDFPVFASSELTTPFIVRVVDIYNNPTPAFINAVDVSSTGVYKTFSGSNHTFAPADKGTHVYYLRWDFGNPNETPVYPPGDVTVTFAPNPPVSIPGGAITWTLRVDNPRSTTPEFPFLRSWLSLPDRQVIASEPFKMTYKSLSIRETNVAISSIIDISVSDGSISVSRDGISYSSSITLANESEVTFWAIVNRTGSLSVVATPKLAPAFTGSVGFLSHPGPVAKITIQAETPQKAGEKFPWTLEWWDACDNYARKAVEVITMSAAAIGLSDLDPQQLLLSGHDGRFNQQDNQQWLTDDFIVASATSNLKVDYEKREISIKGLYDENFSENLVMAPAPNGKWKIMEADGSGVLPTYEVENGQLRIWTVGAGSISNHLCDTSTNNTRWRENGDDSYYYLYFDWPANDIFAFNATLTIKRMWFDTALDFSLCHAGIMMRDDSHATRPRFVSAMLRRVDNSYANNRDIGVFSAQAVYRNAPNDWRYRRKLGISPSTVNTHPLSVGIWRDAHSGSNPGRFRPMASHDGQSWRELSGSNGIAPNPQPNVAATVYTKLGISVGAGSTTRPGMAWIDDFRVNRYPQSANFTSVVYDIGTSTVTLTNPIRVNADFNTGNVRLYMRGSNNAATIGGMGWTQLALAGGGPYTANPSAFNNRRYIQYALTLDAHIIGTRGGQTFYDATPYVRSVQIDYTTGTQGAKFAERNVEPPATIIASFSPTITADTQVEILGGIVAALAIDVPASVTAGVPFTVSVQALDTFGNIADDYNRTWSFTTSDGEPFPGFAPGDYTVVPAADAGQHTFHNASILYNGPTSTITVSDGTLTKISTPIIVNPGRIGAFTIIALSPQPAGTIFPLSIGALDVYNNLKTDYAAPMSFSDNHTGGTAVYTPITLVVGNWLAGLATVTPGVYFTKAETVNVTAQSSYRSGLSNPIDIINAQPAALLLSVSTTSPGSGIPFSATVKALDIYGNIAKNYVGKISFACNDTHPAVVLPIDYQFVPGDFGQKTLTSEFMLVTPGPVNLGVVDTVNATMTHQFPLTVLPGLATRFELNCADIQTAGVPFNLIVKVYDDYGNLKTNFSETINLLSAFDSISPVSAGGFSNGQLLIPSVELNDAGVLPATMKIQAVFGSVTGERNVTLWPSSLDFKRFDMETIPVEPTVGDAFKLVIKAVGADGNVYTSYDNAGVYLTASNSSGLAVDPPMMPVEANSFTIGVKELYARNWEAGEITIWAANKGVLIPQRIGSLTVNFLPTNLSHFNVVPGTSTIEPYANNYYQAVNGSFPLHLTAYDTIGNIKTDYSGKIQITHNGTGTLSVTTATFVDGVATISATAYNDYGKIRLTARDNVLDRSGTSGNLYFFGPLAKFDVSCGYHQTDETPFVTQLTAVDIYSQEKLNYAGLINTEKLTWDLGPLTGITLAPVTPP